MGHKNELILNTQTYLGHIAGAGGSQEENAKEKAPRHRIWLSSKEFF